VRAWVRQHPCWPALRHQWDDDQWVILAFERFWQAMRADRLAHFPTLASLLAYLKMCVHSALVDEARSLRASRSEALPEEGYDGGRDETTDVGALALERLAARELWHAIAETLSPDEQLVIVLSFAAGHKPREIARRHADRFVSVAQVYYLKRNALDRLRRNSLLLAGRPASRPAQQGAPAVCRPGARPTHAPSPACAYRAPLRRVA
jgi:DNA-directed RNA polymerase specialized sigma24 family protein